jgi:hypothetical protein
MAEKKLPMLLTTRSFQEHIINWSDDTIRRRIQHEGLPGKRDGKSYIFCTNEVLEWFARKGLKVG